MESNPQLIANREAVADPVRRAKIEQIATLLKGALAAEGVVGLKMNVPRAQLKAVTSALPSVTAPTVADLLEDDWVSVETIIAETAVRDLVPALLKAGAVGIVEYPLNKLI